MNAVLKKKGFWISCISMVLVIATAGYFVGTSFLHSGGALQQVRTVELQKSEVDYQSILDDFEDAELTIDGSVADFVGYKTIDASILSQFDNLSQSDIAAADDGTICYHFTYDVETNVVTIQAEVSLENGSVIIDTISGIGFYNDADEIDAVMNIEGEGILLSEMRNAGIIQNCGWLSSLVKAVVVAVVVVAVVVIVATVVVSTAGAAAPAVVAVGVGAVSSTAVTAGGAVLGVVAGAIVTLTVGQAAIQAGTAVGEALGDGFEQVIDRTTKALLEILYKGVRYATAILTATLVAKLAKNAYFIVMANPKDGNMYYSPIAIDKNMAISIMNFNTVVSIYTFDPTNARSVAQRAGNNMSPVHDNAHDIGYFNHYHLGNIPHSLAYSHAFYGLPI